LRHTWVGHRCNPVSHPFSRGTASANGGTFAPGYGSDLLSLKNAFRLQAVDAVFRAYGFERNQSARNCAFPVPDCSPHWTGLFAAPTFFGRLWWDTPPPAPSMRTDGMVAFFDLLGHHVRHPDFETLPECHDWARRGFDDRSSSDRRLASTFTLSQFGGVRPPPAQRVKNAFVVSARRRGRLFENIRCSLKGAKGIRSL
jgi:hypothetical protein